MLLKHPVVADMVVKNHEIDHLSPDGCLYFRENSKRINGFALLTNLPEGYRS